MTMWKITAGRGSRLTQSFLDHSCVAIGWHQVGYYSDISSREQLIERFTAAYPERTPAQVSVAANQAWRFLKVVKTGDGVIVYHPPTRNYILGTVISKPEYQPDLIPDLPVRRLVKWNSTRINRDDLSQATKNSLGAILTLFRVPLTSENELSGKPTALSIDVEDEGVIVSAEPLNSDAYNGLEELARERIKDRLIQLSWDEMQEMVASLLRALGYRTIISPAGPDRGKDIIASKDGFGFEPPRIVVEVKHRPRQSMGAPEIRAFLGGRHAEDRGLYVSTGGFTKEAHFEAERASTVTHLMTLDDLAKAIIESYDQIDERGKVLLPLQKLYWPI